MVGTIGSRNGTAIKIMPFKRHKAMFREKEREWKYVLWQGLGISIVHVEERSYDLSNAIVRQELTQ